MNLSEFVSHGQAVFVNVAHVVTVRHLQGSGGGLAAGKTSVLLSTGDKVEIDGEAREVAARRGTIFYS